MFDISKEKVMWGKLGDNISVLVFQLLVEVMLREVLESACYQ